MKFERRPGFVCFHDNQPRSYVSLHGPTGQDCPFRNEASSFSDEKRVYMWAFAYEGELKDGEQFVFRAGGFKAVGEIKNGQIEIQRKVLPVHLGLVKGEEIIPSASARCLMVNPSVPYGSWACYRVGVMNEAAFSAHGMAYVSAALKNQGHSCWLLDLRSHQNWAHVAESIRAQEYDVAFVGFLSIDAFNAAAVVRLLKEIHPNRPVVVGGLHVSIAKEEIFPRPDLIEHYCFDRWDLIPDVFKQFLQWKGENRYDSSRFPLADYVILDDGEIAAQRLVADLVAGRQPPERTIQGGAVPMEVARHMDRDLFRLDFEAYSPILPFQPTPMVTMTWARGCSYKCTYCFTSDMIVHTEYGFERIADVVRREEPVRVIQADGTIGRAVRFSERSYRGSIIRIGLHYQNFPIEATPNHKLRVYTTDGVWVDREASALTISDRLFVPTPRGENVAMLDVESLLREAGEEPQRIGSVVRLKNGKTSIAAMIPWSDEFLFLLGIYLAEGCVTYADKRPNSVALAFTLGKHEAHLQEKIIRLIKEVFGIEARPQEQPTSEQVWCGSGIIAKIFEYLCGPDSVHKKVHRWLLGLPNAMFLKIVTAWLIGDGNPGAFDHPHSCMSGSTVSPSLSWALWTRLLGCGVAASIHRKKRPIVCSEIEGRKVNIEEFFYEINFLASEEGRRLADAAFGARCRLPSKLQFPFDFCDGGALIPIASLESVYNKDPVFNMEVTPDHTYTVNGCAVHNCNLSSQLSNTNVRTKPVELVEEELDDMHRRFGGHCGSIMLHDDLTFHIRHIAEWAELILRKYGPIPIWMQTRAPMIVAWYQHRRELWELLCRAGLTYVSVGFESGSQRMLDYMKKDATVEENIECGRILDEYGINSFANFLWGVPSESNEEAEETVRLVEKIKPGFLSGSIYCSFPGTAQDRECREKGLFVPGQVYNRSHLPWQYAIKGIDYAHRFDCVSRAGRYSNYLRMPKMLSADRQRELAATSRGLSIH